MTPLRTLALTLALATVGLRTASAQSLIEVYDAARAYDAAFQSAQAAYDAAESRAQQLRAGLLPQVGLQLGVSRAPTDVRVRGLPSTDYNVVSQTAGISATQPLYRPANAISYTQGQRQVEVYRAALDAAAQDLLVRTSQAYFDVLGAQDTLAFVRAQKAAVAEQLASAKRNFDVGTATITDAREAQARYDLVAAQEIATENDLQVKRLALDQLAGRAGIVPQPLTATGTLADLQPQALERWVEQAQTTQPSVRQARLALEVARLDVKKAEAAHLPTVDLQAGYSAARYPNGTTTVPAHFSANGGSIGVQLNIPIFAGYSIQNRVRETLSLEDKARADLDTALRNVAQSTRALFFGAVSSAGQVKALETAEASSQSALEANQLGYQVGVRINIDVLNAQSQLYQTKRDLAQARYNLLLTSLRLRQAAGTLAPQDLYNINALLASAPCPSAEQKPSDTACAPR